VKTKTIPNSHSNKNILKATKIEKLITHSHNFFSKIHFPQKKQKKSSKRVKKNSETQTKKKKKNGGVLFFFFFKIRGKIKTTTKKHFQSQFSQKIRSKNRSDFDFSI
jgi:tRNA C32,U32 (ribose-2'-O)-methylase TrmJ